MQPSRSSVAATGRVAARGRDDQSDGDVTAANSTDGLGTPLVARAKEVMARRPHDQTTAGRALFLNCPRCGLSLRRRMDTKIEGCPRCLGRAGIEVKLVISTRPAPHWHRARIGG